MTQEKLAILQTAFAHGFSFLTSAEPFDSLDQPINFLLGQILPWPIRHIRQAAQCSIYCCWACLSHGLVGLVLSRFGFYGLPIWHPDIVEAIVEGRQPRSLTVKLLLRGIPLAWTDQRAAFGFTH